MNGQDLFEINLNSLTEMDEDETIMFQRPSDNRI